jgi:SAM-dependent methyltransferase
LEKNDNTYILDPESGAEMARLIDQDRLITKAMGGLLPPDFVPGEDKVVLDLACGPGGWAQEVTFQYPSLQVTGIDISRKMINYAQSLAAVQHFENLVFQIMDLRALPLDFPDDSFDYVNTRFLTSFLFKDDWPNLIEECLRLLRPGGTLRFTEGDRASRTTSPAFEEMQRIFLQYNYQTGRCFDLMDRGTTIRLPHLLRKAACKNVRVQTHTIDWSINTPAWSLVRRDFELGIPLVRPFTTKSGLITEERWMELWEQAQREFYAPDFGALWQFVSVWGQKP